MSGRIVISAKCERSEHWRRLTDWSFCVSVVPCVYTMTQERWCPPVNTSTFYSSNV